MNRFIALLASLCFISLPASAGTLTVAVAANLQYAFDELQVAFQEKTGHRLKPVFNSSGKFAAQILHGAPFDVFVSADIDYPQKLHTAGLTADAPRIYARGLLVLWTMKQIDLQHWQSTLAGAAVRKIAVANPKTAPYGRETMRLLARLQLEQPLKQKLVFGESIAQTNQYIHSQAADAGFTAKSVVLSPEMRGQGQWIDLPRQAYQPIAQGVVVLIHARQTDLALAQQFRDFLLSPAARAILARYGYLPP